MLGARKHAAVNATAATGTSDAMVVIGIATAAAGMAVAGIGIVAANVIAAPAVKIVARIAMPSGVRIAVATARLAMTATVTTRPIARGDATVGGTWERASPALVSKATAIRAALTAATVIALVIGTPSANR